MPMGLMEFRPGNRIRDLGVIRPRAKMAADHLWTENCVSVRLHLMTEEELANEHRWRSSLLCHCA
jgi:hypothetical protein